MVLAITFLILPSLISFNNILKQIYIVYVLVIASIKLAICLKILIAFYIFHSFLILLFIFYSKKTCFLPCIVFITYVAY